MWGQFINKGSPMAALNKWSSRQWVYFVDDLLLRDHVFVRRQDLATEKLVLRWGEMSGGKDTVIDAELLLATLRGYPLKACLSTLAPVELEGGDIFYDISAALNSWGLREDGSVVCAVDRGTECVFRALHAHLSNVLVAVHVQKRFVFQSSLVNHLLIRETPLSKFVFRAGDKDISMEKVLSTFTSVMVQMCFPKAPTFMLSGREQMPARKACGRRHPGEETFCNLVQRFLTMSSAFEATWLSEQQGGFHPFLRDFVERGFRIIHGNETPPLPPYQYDEKIMGVAGARPVPVMPIIQCMEQLVMCTMTEGIFFCHRAVMATVAALQVVLDRGLHTVPEETWLSLAVSFDKMSRKKIEGSV